MRLMVETKYDLLLSQRLILQPNLQATAGLTRDRDLGPDPKRYRLACGCVTRSPGVLHRMWVGSANMVMGGMGARARGRGTSDDEKRWVAGIRCWF